MRGGHAAQGFRGLFSQTGAGRIDDNSVRCELGGAFGEESLRRATNALYIRRNIAAQVGEGMRRRFDCQHLIEITRQVMSKQASAGIEIECGSSCLMADDDFDKLVDQETVGLKEGATADPVVMFHSVVQERIPADGLRGFGMD